MVRTLVAVAALAVAVAGCGGVENEPNLAKAAERTEAAGSGRFEMRGVLVADDDRWPIACTGSAIYAAKRVQVRCDEGLFDGLELIAIGEDTYTRDEGGTLDLGGPNGKWLHGTFDPDADNALASFSPEKLLRSCATRPARPSGLARRTFEARGQFTTDSRSSATAPTSSARAPRQWTSGSQMTASCAGSPSRTTRAT
jgi:hypothetical protein